MRTAAMRGKSGRKAMPVAALLLLLSCGDAGAAATYSVLYDFCSQTGCADGARPVSILSAGAGRLFGTTYPGGANNGGAIFELERNRAGGISEKVIYSFCALRNCADGQLPQGSLIRDTGGNLYGVTNEGGASGPGEVYELVHRHDGWTLEILYSFCSRTNCSDGKFPWAGLAYAGGGTTYDGTSPLFGTTNGGGANGSGTVFELRRGRHGWTAKTLYSFCALSACADGASPAAALTIGTAGNIYGTTQYGGQGPGLGTGVVFELTRSGKGWTETVLHAFCGDKSCTDGAVPAGGVVMDASGTLFGSTNRGGISCADLDFGPCGVIYSLVPEGANSPYSVLYTFGQGGRSDDGANPVGSPLLDASGDLFAVTAFGGAGGNGVAWEFTGSKLKVLHTFCATAGDGCNPSYLYRDAKGRLFGTTSAGGTGTDSNGMAFEIRP